jgi:hypothetical protein
VHPESFSTSINSFVVLSHALVRWAPRLPRLQTLELRDGKPLEDELVHASIQQHCPQFNSLSIYKWLVTLQQSSNITNMNRLTTDRDHKLAKFIGSVRPQSLRMIETISDIGAGAETFAALNGHSATLQELKLCVSNESLPHLSLLRGCTALETLKIEDYHGTMDLAKTQNDVFIETIDWLRKCEHLQTLSLTKLLSASAIVTPLLLEDSIRLRRLDIDYVPHDSYMFHQALTYQQPSLRYLTLRGDTEGMFRDDIDILVDSIKQLTELRVLKLMLIQEVFHDEHIIAIIPNLRFLEDLYIPGIELKDAVLECLGRVPNLRSVTFSGISKFTTDGFMEFVSLLGPGNHEIRVMVDMADPDTLLSDDEVQLVRESIAQKVGGTFDYTPLRGNRCAVSIL